MYEWKYKYHDYSIERLRSFGISPEVVYRYNEDHRFYHNWEHIEDLLKQIEKRDHKDRRRSLMQNDALFLATIYHDAVYDAKANDNEEKSAELFKIECKKGGKKLKDEVVRIILDTKLHNPTSKLSAIFSEMDMDILQRPLTDLINYENKIFKEFQCYDWLKYKQGRISVLRKFRMGENLEPLISYIEARKPKIAVYPGSFNPFHKGHYNILKKAEQIFDKVIIARGVNPDKKASSYALPEDINFRQIESYDGLLTDFAKSLNYDVRKSVV